MGFEDVELMMALPMLRGSAPTCNAVAGDYFLVNFMMA